MEEVTGCRVGEAHGGQLVSISGAGRELTEGVGSLVAAVILVSVGIWMHGKSSAAAWQRSIFREEKAIS